MSPTLTLVGMFSGSAQSARIPPASPGRTTQQFRNSSAFVALKADWSVVA